MVVYKYVLPPSGGPIELPQGARILSVQTQNGQPQIWALVDPHAPRVSRTLIVKGTGHDGVDPDWLYHGTFQMLGGALVFHLFEETAS